MDEKEIQGEEENKVEKLLVKGEGITTLSIKEKKKTKTE